MFNFSTLPAAHAGEDRAEVLAVVVGRLVELDVQLPKLGGADAWSDDAMAGLTAGQLADLIDRFDASVECRHVTCLYNSVNWWLETQVEQPSDELDIEAGEARLDFFL